MADTPKKRGSTVATNDLSRHFLATMAQWTGGLSPQAFGGAWLNVLTRLAVAPGRQAELARAALQKTLALAQFSGAALQGEAPRAAGTPYANRFADPAWAKFPFNVLAESFISVSDWAREAVRNVPGADAAAENIVGFTVREGLELVAPDNYLPTNPQLIRQTVDENGRNLLRGVKHLAEDVTRTLKGLGPIGVEHYKVGEQVAATPGKVILRTPLMELIQYSPQTATVYAEPVLIVPAWIMKYYILDLSPKNSLVNYLTGLGHTVFMVSWKNPTAEDRNVTMDDYLTLGVRAALDAVTKVVPKHKVHAVGYCIGGTLLAIAAAELAAQDDDRLASVTMFAAQTDFSEPGELSIFISPAQLAMLEAMMWKEGVLESRQMGGAFQLLRTYDLLWAPTIGTYLRGERVGVNDLMSWNADGTRMAYRMHTDYLHQLYLNNDLAEGRYVANGEQLELSDIRLPMFVVGTETDHVAPWRSVYKVGKLVRSTDYTFCLTSGGHNAGIISGPQHPKRRHRVHTSRSGARLLSPDRYLEKVEPLPGSWWPTWAKWLEERSGARKVAPPPMGAPKQGLKPLGKAPGTYVLAK
ncbi:MAG TPA: alpha/beta fold hydrolase [Steroidobacteraceae bacterium]|jgi:polyhydroxyalkanoate synthase|nr:alpha/beta fold hydrolase [Steroidobacteraceae bacterium]